jgi:dimeric dUTPase (all-alpha-NTP-PPase superfamily)
MLELQNTLNIKTIGDNWFEDDDIKWLRYLRIEATEALTSAPFKHWKDVDKKLDIENAKVEVVDMWHFYLSELLRMDKHKDSSKIASILADNYRHIHIDKDEYTEREYNEEFMVACEAIINISFRVSMVQLYYSMLDLLDVLHMDMTELYTLYMTKNVLNAFRQNFGCELPPPEGSGF